MVMHGVNKARLPAHVNIERRQREPRGLCHVPDAEQLLQDSEGTEPKMASCRGL